VSGDSPRSPASAQWIPAIEQRFASHFFKENAMKTNQAMKYAAAVALALALSTAYAADDTKTTDTTLTGKEKATAIGAGSGAVAGAVVGGPVGALVGAGIGAYVGNQGTDANGRVSTDSNGKMSSARPMDETVRNAQAALNTKGYDVGRVDGQWGPNTQNAVRRFQSENGLAQSGRLDSATLTALGINS
jgi:hypothetical protein